MSNFGRQIGNLDIMSSGRILYRVSEWQDGQRFISEKVLGQIDANTVEQLRSWVEGIDPRAEIRKMTDEEKRFAQGCGFDGGGGPLVYGTQFYTTYGSKLISGTIPCRTKRLGFDTSTPEGQASVENELKVLELLSRAAS